MPDSSTALALTLAQSVRFWSKVDRSGCCWLWIAGVNHDGYGRFWLNGKKESAHRVSWVAANGPIPPGRGVLHNCPDGDNPACVNPDHLFLGTTLDNMRDKVAKGRHRGGFTPGESHPRAKLTGENVLEIRQRCLVDGETRSSVAVMFRVSQSAVSRIAAGKRWLAGERKDGV